MKEQRKAIKAAAIELIEEIGVVNIDRKTLCERAGVPAGSFHYVMGVTFTAFLQGLPKDERTDIPVSKKRIDPKHRRELILLAAVNVARDAGLGAMTRAAVAAEAGVSNSLITSHFRTMVQLRRAVMRYAVQNEILEVIGQGVIARDAQAMKAPEHVRKAAVEALA
jgi:DNA-binding transcriptional regulator YbjK